MAACISDYQALLIKAFEERNLTAFKTALENQADPNELIKNTNISVFEKCLQNYDCVKFVEECIKNGCQYDYINTRLHKNPINFATDSRNPEIISQLLQFKHIPVDSEYANLTPINSLAKNITSDNFVNVFKCMQLLIQYGADPNIPDHQETTPIIHIIKNQQLNDDNKKTIIKYLLNLENSKIDIDSYRQGKGDARTLLKKNFPDIQLPMDDTSELSCHSLSILLGKKQENQFIQRFKKYQSHLSKKEEVEGIKQKNYISLLIIAIQKDLNKAIEVILESGIDVNIPENGYTPIEVACNEGKHEGLKILLKQDNLILRDNENLLIKVTKKLDETNEINNYMGCFEVLLDSPKIDVNEVDDFKSTALHYAVKYKNEEAIMMLLNKGAYIGNKNCLNTIPISGIHGEILENYFNKCITTNGYKPGDDNFEININYKNLLPNNTSQNEEMLPIKHIAESEDLKHLLNHPLITSFLFLKWRKLSFFFYINFIFYFLFCTSLVLYIFLDFNNASDESVQSAFKILSLLGLFYIILRETIQFILSPRMFITSIVNYFEIALIILTILTLLDSNYRIEPQRTFAVLTILLASIELYLLVGSLPVLTISTHLLMLEAVSVSFIKSFSQYSIFLITFGLCFHIVFRKAENSNNRDDSENDDGYFNSTLGSIFKAFVMLTGEFDSGSINFNSPISYVIFIIFVSFLAIVLLNLLNGLAVSDTQIIRAQAELNGSICRTYLLASHEKSLIDRNERAAFFKNIWPFNSICKKLTTSFKDYIHGNKISIRPNDGNKILISKRSFRDSISMESISSNSMSIPINDDDEKMILDAPIPISPCCCCCSCFKIRCSAMEDKAVEDALAVIEKKQQIQKEEKNQLEQENRLKNLEKKVDKILILLQRSESDHDM